MAYLIPVKTWLLLSVNLTYGTPKFLTGVEMSAQLILTKITIEVEDLPAMVASGATPELHTRLPCTAAIRPAQLLP